MNATTADLRALAEPSSRGEKIAMIIGRAARMAGLPYWRAFDIWYGKARRISAEEHSAIRAALAEKLRKEAANELHDLRLRLTRLEALMAADHSPVDRPDDHQAHRQGRGLART